MGPFAAAGAPNHRLTTAPNSTEPPSLRAGGFVVPALGSLGYPHARRRGHGFARLRRARILRAERVKRTAARDPDLLGSLG